MASRARTGFIIFAVVMALVDIATGIKCCTSVDEGALLTNGNVQIRFLHREKEWQADFELVKSLCPQFPLENVIEGNNENDVVYVLENDTDILAFGDFMDYFTTTTIKISRFNAFTLRDLAVKFGLRMELIQCINDAIVTFSQVVPIKSMDEVSRLEVAAIV